MAMLSRLLDMNKEEEEKLQFKDGEREKKCFIRVRSLERERETNVSLFAPCGVRCPG